MRKKNNILYLFLLIIPSMYCGQLSHQKGQDEIAILNDVFLSIVDTVAYKYHNLRPAPNGIVFDGQDTLLVAVLPVLISVKPWQNEIKLILDRKGKPYSDLFIKTINDSTEQPFDPGKLTNTGRYRLTVSPKRKNDRNDLKGTIGKVVFTRLYYDDSSKAGFVVVNIKEPIKNGVIKLAFLKKIKEKWVKEDEDVIEIW
jgi:hypothetical protein